MFSLVFDVKVEQLFDIPQILQNITNLVPWSDEMYKIKGNCLIKEIKEEDNAKDYMFRYYRREHCLK